jgi:hypothetical protein
LGLNSLGLGFSFGARDTGMSKGLANQTKGLGLMESALQKLDGILSVNKLSTFIESVSLSRLNDIAEKIGDIATQGRNLTTSYESQITAGAKAGKAAAANFGYSSAEMGKFASKATGLGIALNISTDEAGKAQYAWENGADVLKAVGIDSAATAAKVEQIYKIDPSKFIWTLKEMHSNLGMNDDQIRLVMDSTQAWGQQTADVAGAMGKMQGMVDHLNEKAHSLNKTLSAEELTQYAVSTNQAKQLLYALGNNAEQAEKAVDSFNDTTLKSAKNQTQLFAGASNDLSNFMLKSAEAGISLDEQTKLMKEGPLGFIKGLSGMIQKTGGFSKLSGEQMGFIKTKMEEALGPEMAGQLFNTFKQGDAAVSDMLTKLPKVTESIGKSANAAYSTGRTLSDEMELAESQFVARLRRQSKAGQKFLEDSKKNYKKWGDSLTNIASGSGPLAALANKMIAVHQIGSAALLPAGLAEIAAPLGTIVKEGAPVVGMLGAMGFRMKMLVSLPLLLVAGLTALVTWFVTLRLKLGSTSAALAEMAATAGQFLTDLPKHIMMALVNIVTFFSNFTKTSEESGPDWKRIFEYWGTKIKDSWNTFGPVILNLLKQLFGMMTTWFQANAPGLIQDLFAALKTGVVAGIGLVKEYGPVILNALADGLVAYWSILADGLRWAVNEALTILEEIDFSAAISSIGTTAIDTLGRVLEGVGPVLDKFFAELPDMLMRAWDIVKGIAANLPADLGKLLSGLGAKLKEVLPGVLKGLFKFILNIPGMVLSIFWDLLKALPGTIKLILWDIPKMLLSLAVDIVIGVTTAIMAAIDEFFPSISTFFNDVTNFFTNLSSTASQVWTDIKGFVTDALAALGPIIDTAIDALMHPWDTLKTFISSIWEDIPKWVDTGMTAAANLISGFMDTFVKPFKTMGDFAGSLFSGGSSPTTTSKAVQTAQNKAVQVAAGPDKALATPTALTPRTAQTLATPAALVSGSTQTLTSKPAPSTLPKAQPAKPSTTEAQRQDSLVSAVHNPDWYYEYKKLYIQSNQALLAAIKGPSKATAPPSRRLKEKSGMATRGLGLAVLVNPDGGPSEG